MCTPLTIISLCTASQMWCLARMLPFLIGDKIPDEDEYWEHYLLLLSILEYTFSPLTTKEKLAYLAVMIEDFLTEFRGLYQRKLIPKMHYMVHIPT